MGVDLDLAHYAGVAIDDAVRQAIAAGAVVAFSLSGGKDSTAAADAANRALDVMGHARADRIAIHADLGRAEWRSTPAIVERVAEHLEVPLIVVQRRKGDMVSRWEERFEAGKRRYAALEVFNLIGPWSSASLRFCTAELKQQVISPALKRLYPGRTIISVVGIRREESAARRLAQVSKPESRWDGADGTRLITWHPGLHWSAAGVFSRHHRLGLPLHEAYTAYGSSRLSCAFCILQSGGDQKAAAGAPGNRDLLLHLVALEARSTFSFQPERWLADVSGAALPDHLGAAVAHAKSQALVRRHLEGGLPKGLRYVKGWPVRLPTQDEAAQVVAARDVILRQHDLPIHYPTAQAVTDQFSELMAANLARAA